MVGEKILINEKEYKIIGKNRTEYFIESSCVGCGSIFYKKKYKKTKFCSQSCQFHKILNIDDVTNQIINGSLLSDGSITKSKKDKNYGFTHTCKFEEYIDFINYNLSFKTKKIENRKYFYLRSGNHEFFSNLRRIWYPNGVKEVPKDIKLTPLTLLHWYLGDGSLQNSLGVVLCTDSFNNEDSLFLSKKLFEVFKIESYILEKKNRIVIPNKFVYEFFNVIGECPVECYSHKWDSIVKKSYFNRVCGYCSKNFDANYNHQRFCSNRCCKNSWHKRNTE